MVYEYEEIIPGDIVAVRHGTKGRQEGLVVGSHVDYQVKFTCLCARRESWFYHHHSQGRQIIEVQLDTEVYHAWYDSS